MLTLRRLPMALGTLLFSGAMLHAAAQDAPSSQDGPLTTQRAAPIERSAPEAQTPDAQTTAAPAEALPPGPPYDPGIFQKRVLPTDLAFLTGFSGATSNEVYRDKRFHKILRNAIPNVMFHYGVDVSLPDALDQVISGSAVPVVLRDERYLSLGGSGTHHDSHGLVWVDLKEGLILCAFFFRPGNGEPTPTVTVFTKQIKEDSIEMTQLPPAFIEDLTRWQMAAGIPTVTTRYFIGDENRKLLLEHDEDYCTATVGRPGDDCMQLTADAADVDVVAASYLDQVHYATNATAWRINSPDQVAWVGMRDRTCGDGLACRIRMTHERIHVIQHRSGRR